MAYTEPFYTLCVFVGSWLVVKTSSSTRLERLDVTTSRMRKSKLYGMLRGAEKTVVRSIGIACLMLASGTRSLGMLNCAVIAWPVLLRIYHQRFRGFAVSSTPKQSYCFAGESLILFLFRRQRYG